jgi:hypothetical protein
MKVERQEWPLVHRVITVGLGRSVRVVFASLKIGLVVALAAPALALGPTPGTTWLGTRWDIPGPKNIATSPPTAGGTTGPGEADWSIVAPLIATMQPPDADHPGPPDNLTLDFDHLLHPANVRRPADLFAIALEKWDVGSLGAWTNLGMVADGGGVIGAAAAASNTGDIRAAVLHWDEDPPLSSQFDQHIIAHAFRPGTMGAITGTIGGDVHFRPHAYGPDGMPGGGDDHDDGVVWVDKRFPVFPEVDLLTVMIHEIGHALGLGHNGAADSVMNPTYMGRNWRLSQADKQNIRRLYGAVPEPGSAVLLAMALPWLTLRGVRRRAA